MGEYKDKIKGLRGFVTIGKIERSVGRPAIDWHGMCFGVATETAKLLRGAVAVYGHYTGPVARSGFWGRRANHPFQQHGWVLQGSRIVDPTRWSFEDRVPALYVTDADDPEYDEGANGWREAVGPKAPPPFDANEKIVSLGHLPEGDGVKIKISLLLGEEEVREDPDSGVVISVKQLFWLANCPYRDLEPYVSPIYGIIESAGFSGFIPLDNRRRAEREAACRS